MWAKPTGLWHDDSGRCVGYTERREPSPCSHAACNLRLWAVYSLASFSAYGKASRLASFPAAHGKLGNEATRATAQAAAFHYYRNSCSPYRIEQKMFRTPTTSTARNGNGGSRRSLWTPTMTNRAPSPSRPAPRISSVALVLPMKHSPLLQIPAHQWTALVTGRFFPF